MDKYNLKITLWRLVFFMVSLIILFLFVTFGSPEILEFFEIKNQILDIEPKDPMDKIEPKDPIESKDEYTYHMPQDGFTEPDKGSQNILQAFWTFCKEHAFEFVGALLIAYFLWLVLPDIFTLITENSLVVANNILSQFQEWSLLDLRSQNMLLEKTLRFLLRFLNGTVTLTANNSDVLHQLRAQCMDKLLDPNTAEELIPKIGQIITKINKILRGSVFSGPY